MSWHIDKDGDHHEEESRHGDGDVGVFELLLVQLSPISGIVDVL